MDRYRSKPLHTWNDGRCDTAGISRASEPATHKCNPEPRGQKTILTMVRNTGTSPSSADGTSRSYTDGTNPMMLRRSFDIPRHNMDLYTNNQRSLSDSELVKTSKSLSSMTSEFLDLPPRLNIRSSSPHSHRLEPEKLYLDLTKVKSDRSHKHSDSQRHEQGDSVFEPPKIEYSNIDVVIDDVEGNSDSHQPELFLNNERNYDNDDYISRRSHLWFNLDPQMHNLDPQMHALLSPRSSNGSICSYRSSNADSAIEMLTPDEDMHERSLSESSDCRVWENEPKSKCTDIHELWNDSVEGAIHDVQIVHSTPVCKETCLQMCSKSSVIETSPLNTDSSNAFHAISQQILPHTTNLPSSEESNKRTVLPNPRPPSVVISDFSSKISLENKSCQTSASDIIPGAHGEFLGDQCLFFRRSLSNSSVSSNESSFSFHSDSSQDVDDQDEFPVKLAKKQSSWKKIRNIVHWSPFIQQFKRRKYPWIQLAGHQGNFQAGSPGAILKKFDKAEHRSFNLLMKDVLGPYVPEYRGEVEKDGDCYVQQQDLLCEFEAPCVMDMKMGCRTYLEDELSKAREKPTLRKDMYQKMVDVDRSAPTAEEHAQNGVTKPRYMQWRDDISSTTELGFRIEGIRKSDGAQVKNFKKTKDKASVKQCLKQFVEENPIIIIKYLKRLNAIRATQEVSPFFKSHEVIGSSLLFVHDKTGQAKIWMIDFGKTVPLPGSVTVTHRKSWVEGNHEDGYLIGIDSLIVIFEELNSEFQCSDSASELIVESTSTHSDSMPVEIDTRPVKVEDKDIHLEDSVNSVKKTESTV